MVRQTSSRNWFKPVTEKLDSQNNRSEIFDKSADTDLRGYLTAENQQLKFNFVG